MLYTNSKFVGTDENHEISVRVSCLLREDLNAGIPKDEAAVLFTWILRVRLLGFFLSRFTLWNVLKWIACLGDCLWYEEIAVCSEIAGLHCVQSLGSVDMHEDFTTVLLFTMRLPCYGKQFTPCVNDLKDTFMGWWDVCVKVHISQWRNATFQEC
jgi:hypothetical protein